MSILEEIINFKKLEVEKAKEKDSFENLNKKLKTFSFLKREFTLSLKNKVIKKEIGLIAEVKKASPSKGIIKEDFSPTEIAVSYEKGGASCISVLTDEKYFHGSLSYIKEIKEKIKLPVLRKDFIIDPYQIVESKLNHADCVLLIISALNKDLFKNLLELAYEHGLDVLTEIHNEEELETALDILGNYKQTQLIGINNRNLKTFETKIETSINLVARYKKDLENKVVISESGIFTNKDIKILADSGIYCFLVGEGLIKEKNITKATIDLITR